MHHPHHHHAHAPGAEQAHGHGAAASGRRLLWALIVTVSFMVVEVAGGLIAGSLALLADAAHMVTDAAALFLAWLALRVAERPADLQRSYGYHRIQVLAAFVNGLALLPLSAWIVIEALQRLGEPTAVTGGIMLAIAAAGLVVNAVAFLLLHGADRTNLNVRGAALHVLSDLLGSAAAIAAAVVILTTGWMPIDPLLSIVVAALIVRSAWVLLRRSGHILMEGAPAELDAAAVKRHLVEAVPAVLDVHHVHAWSLTPDRPLLTMHARIDEAADPDDTLRRIHEALASRLGVDHATVQIERVCPDPRG